jgi:hypothetical protein
LALPAPSPRQPAHHRRLDIHGYRRDDGLWDIEGHLTDSRPVAMEFPDGLRPPGAPIHSMRVRLTFDDTLLIVAASAATEAAPFGQACGAITPAYEQLVGLRFARGFRGHLRRLFGAELGCTHITELIGAMASGAIQTLAKRSGLSGDPDQKPFQIDGCHALQSTGPTVALHYPRWYRRPVDDEAAAAQPSPGGNGRNPA